PTKEEEREIIRRNINDDHFGEIETSVQGDDVVRARQTVRKVYMDDKIEQYIVDIVFATRNPDAYQLSNLEPLIEYGASPRASINMALASKAYAFLRRRGFVIPEDVRAVCHDVLRHRIGLTYEAEAENVTQEDMIKQILNHVEVP
ncbi:MAG: MoxR family ATPase, partial [Saprospiraceae bacterium]|nr:MoxR family ATPase [Saprospiraceae bacterium]